MELLNVCQHSFIALDRGNRTTFIDGGVNKGEFSKAMNKMFPKSTGYGFEPDPRLYRRLPRLDSVTFFEKAIGDSEGFTELFLGDKLCSSTRIKEDEHSKTVIVQKVNLEQFVSSLNINKIDLLKLDIEGAEISVLENFSENFLCNNISQMTIEFHEFLDPSYIPEIERIIEKMKKFNFAVFKLSRTYGDMLFVNKKFIALGSIDYLRIYFTKYFRGGARMLRRTLSFN